MDWQPIETAPKNELIIVTDGTIIAPAISRYGDGWYFWEGGIRPEDDGTERGELNSWIRGYGPTHWMPLPKPPQDPT